MGTSVSVFLVQSGSLSTQGISCQDTSWMGSSGSLGSFGSLPHLLLSDLNLVLTLDGKFLNYFGSGDADT